MRLTTKKKKQIHEQRKNKSDFGFVSFFSQLSDYLHYDEIGALTLIFFKSTKFNKSLSDFVYALIFCRLSSCCLNCKEYYKSTNRRYFTSICVFFLYFLFVFITIHSFHFLTKKKHFFQLNNFII